MWEQVTEHSAADIERQVTIQKEEEEEEEQAIQAIQGRWEKVAKKKQEKVCENTNLLSGCIRWNNPILEKRDLRENSVFQNRIILY